MLKCLLLIFVSMSPVMAAGITVLDSATANINAIEDMGGTTANDIVTLENNATLNMGAALTIANNIGLASAASINTNVFDSTFSGHIFNNGTLSKIGAGILSLTNANNATVGGMGGINEIKLYEGTLATTSDGAFGNSSSYVRIANGATLRIYAPMTLQATVGLANPDNLVDYAGTTTIDVGANDVTASLAGGTPLTKLGAGNFTTNRSSYVGSIIIDAGALTSGTDVPGTQSDLVNVSQFTLRNNSTLRNGGGIDISYGAAIVLDMGGTIDTVANNMTLSGNISGTGVLTKVGSGTLTLNGVKSYNGGTTISAGTLAINNNTSMGSPGIGPANVIFAAGTSLQTNAALTG